LRRLREAGSLVRYSLDLDLARTAAAVMIGRIAAAGAQFALTLIIARSLGAEISGLYYLAFSVATVGSVLGSLGLGTATLRFIATAASENDWPRVAGVHRLGALISGLASAAVGVVIFVLAPWLANTAFDKPDVEPVIRVAALLVPAQTLLWLYGQILKAVHRPIAATVLQVVGPPLAASIILLASGTESATVAMTIVVASTVGFLLLEFIQWSATVGRPARQWGQFEVSTLMRTALPLMVVGSMSLVIMWSDVIIIGVFGTAADVGTYTPAARTALLIQMGLVAIATVVQPQLAVLYKSGKFKRLEQLARNTSLLGTMVGLPALLVIEVAAPWFMSLFGTGFEGGATALRILAVGQLINVSVGNTGLLLSMSGRERYLQRTMVLGALANIILNVTLVPLLGINGAAIATALSVSGVQFANLTFVRRTMDIQPIFFLPLARQ
jgi:O-antigen/teichoic acid export membrane protein